MLTKHAATRSQRRSIPSVVIDWLLDFGRCETAGDGTTKHYFDRPARRRMPALCHRCSRLT